MKMNKKAIPIIILSFLAIIAALLPWITYSWRYPPFSKGGMSYGMIGFENGLTYFGLLIIILPLISIVLALINFQRLVLLTSSIQVFFVASFMAYFTFYQPEKSMDNDIIKHEYLFGMYLYLFISIMTMVVAIGYSRSNIVMNELSPRETLAQRR